MRNFLEQKKLLQEQLSKFKMIHYQNSRSRSHGNISQFIFHSPRLGQPGAPNEQIFRSESEEERTEQERIRENERDTYHLILTQNYWD